MTMARIGSAKKLAKSLPTSSVLAFFKRKRSHKDFKLPKLLIILTASLILLFK